MQLTIFSAGVAMQVVKDASEKWNAAHPECLADIQFGGSVDLARRIVQGAPCDFFISADDTLISTVLIPGGGIDAGEKSPAIFARNSMVITRANPAARPITSGNWKEILLAPNATFAHFNPYADPGGYRAVMCILLADNIERGLSDKLMNHRGHIGLDKNLGKGNLPPHDYLFMYRSGAAQKNLQFAELPAVINLGDASLESTYNSVSFAVDEKTTVRGTAIHHACVIPKSSPLPEQAREFKELFLVMDFKKYHFT